jgi:pyridoxine 5'-phosphate synthase PdxJ
VLVALALAALLRGTRLGLATRAVIMNEDLARGLGINAGHDLDLDNLVLFRDLPFLDEVSIGHAIVSRAVFAGLDSVVREYVAVLAPAAAAGA